MWLCRYSAGRNVTSQWCAEHWTITITSIDATEAVGVVVSKEEGALKVFSPTNSIYVCGIYLRHNRDSGKFAAHSDCVEQTINKVSYGDSVVIVGDYIFPHLLLSYDGDEDSYIPAFFSWEHGRYWTTVGL